MTGRLCELLVVNDSSSDIRLLRDVVQDLARPLHVSAVHDGVEALAFLRREPPYTHASRPDLILLDINMPRKSGLDVLTELKSDPNLRLIPVVMLTTSAAEQDVTTAYQRYTNAYVTKPFDVDTFVEVMRTLIDFWCGINRRPENPGR